MKRGCPLTVVQSLVAASMVVSSVVAVLVFAGVDRVQLLFPGGVGVGLYVAAAYVWITDPETVISL